MDLFELKKITEGQYRKESLVFHVYEKKGEKHFELVINHISSNSISLRYFSKIWTLFFVTIIIRCVNSHRTKTHDPCRAKYTLNIDDTVKQLIIEDENQSKKQSQKRFKLIDRKNQALFDTNNFTLICKKLVSGKFWITKFIFYDNF